MNRNASRILIWLFVFSILAISIWHCQVNDEKNSNKVLLTIEADSTYLRFGKLWVGYTDTSGNDTVTLWKTDSLSSLEKLKKLLVTVPPGGVIHVIIKGYQSGSNKEIYEEVRDFDVATGELRSTSTPLDLSKRGLRIPNVRFAYKDTVLTIKDSLHFAAGVVDSDRIVFSYAWDFDGNGKYGPEFAFERESDSLRGARTFPDSGIFSLVVRIKDASRKPYFDTLKVHVLQDAPTAFAGQDISVMVQDSVHLHGYGKDSMGKIASYEWKTSDGVYSISKSGDTVFAASKVAMDQKWFFRVTDDDGNQTEDSVVVSITFRSDAYLSALSIRGLMLAPAFERGRFSYSAEVPYSYDSAKVLVRTEDPQASLSINDIGLMAEDSLKRVPLQIGGNLIGIHVKAQNGIDFKDYSIYMVRKKNNDAFLSGLVVDPGLVSAKFSRDTLDYFVTLENGRKSITVTPSASDPLNAKISVNGFARISGSQGDSIQVKIGVDTVRIQVTAHDDSTKKEYRIIVSRLPSPDATLKNIELSVGLISPEFSTKIVRYSDTVAFVVSGLAIKPTLSNASSKIFLKDSSVTSGSFTSNLALSVGDNVFDLKILAESGDSGFYQVLIHRKSSNADLKEIVVGSGKIVPNFSPNQSTYIDTVDSRTDSISIHLKSAHPLVRSIKVMDVPANAAEVEKKFALSDGNNLIPIQVTAEDGNSKSYNLTVYRRNADATLKGLEPSVGVLVPAFSNANKNYSMNIASSDSTIFFIPTPNIGSARVFLKGAGILSGAHSEIQNLLSGDNIFNFVVRSENGDSLTYSVKVHKRSLNANLRKLGVDIGRLFPQFAPANLIYSDTVAAGTKSVVMTVVADDPFSKSITINGTEIPGDSATTSISFSGTLSPVTVKISVKAEEGVEKTYELKIRGPGFIRRFSTKDDDDANNIVAASSGGYLFSDYVSVQPYGINSIMVRFDADGDTLWTRDFKAQSAMVSHVLETATKDFVAFGTGFAKGAATSDIFIGKYDKSGSPIWEKFAGTQTLQESGASILETSDGGFAVVGTQSGDVGDHNDIYFAKLNGSGDTLWTRTFGVVADEEFAYSTVQLPGGDFLVTGRSSVGGTAAYKTFLLRLTASGSLVWMKYYGGAYSNHGSGLAIAADGGFLIVGGTNSTGRGEDGTVMKTTSNGDSLWTKTFGSTRDDDLLSISKTKSGGYVLAGYTKNAANNMDAYLVVTDADMNELWSKTYGGDKDDYAHYGAQTPDGGFLIAGSTSSFGATQKDCLIVKTNAQGDAE